MAKVSHLFGSPVWYPTVNHFCRCSDDPCVHCSGLTRPVACLLDPVVADGRCGRQRVGNVLVAQRLQERDVGALLLGDRRVVRPDTRVAVGLQFGAHAVTLRALGALLGAAERALQVLHVMAELVGDDVLLRQRATAGTELVDEHLEEVGVEVRRLVDGAVERPDVAGRRSAAGVNLTVNSVVCGRV